MSIKFVLNMVLVVIGFLSARALKKAFLDTSRSLQRSEYIDPEEEMEMNFTEESSSGKASPIESHKKSLGTIQDEDSS